MESDEKYAELKAGDELILYHRENHSAWVQSDVFVPLDECL